MHPRPSWPFCGGLVVQAGKLSVPIINSDQSSADCVVVAGAAKVLEREGLLFAGGSDVTINGSLVAGLSAPHAGHPLRDDGGDGFDSAGDVQVMSAYSVRPLVRG